MRKPLVAGNWKMNLTQKTANQLLQKLKQETLNVQDIEVAVFPSFVFLGETQKILSGTPIQWGAQNLNEKPAGAYTGEISGSMLKDFGCYYVLLGHSERRQYFKETNRLVAEKLMAAVQHNLLPIVCVGETKEERLAGRTFKVIQDQLSILLEEPQALDNLVIAYEPVWAIGTGEAATVEQAQEVHEMIRYQVAEVDKAVALKLRILYGGSVVPENAGALSRMPDIDGALVGGASLDVQRFMGIIQQWKH